MIIWGGSDYDTNPHKLLNTGGIYNPQTDEWKPTSLENAPLEREGHTAIWTGSEMIIWGGELLAEGEGGAYNPQMDAWNSISSGPNAPSNSFRMKHSAIWTGMVMIIWGGTNWYDSTGGMYNPLGKRLDPNSYWN